MLAASCAPLIAVAQSPPIDGPSLRVEARAQDLYQSGREHFRAGEFAAAEQDFRRSLDLVDSPNTRMYLGRVLRSLGRLPESWAVFERAALDAERRAATEPRYAATSASARADAAELRGSIGLLPVRADPLPERAEVRVGGAVVPAGALGVPLPVQPGEVTVEILAPGYEPEHRAVTVAAGGSVGVDIALRAVPIVVLPPISLRAPRLDLPPPREPAGPVDGWWTGRRLAGISLLAVGAASALTGLGFGIAAYTEHDTLARQEPGDPALIAQGELHRDVANALLVSGSSVALGGLLMLVVGRSPGSHAAPPLAVGAAPLAGGAALRIGGRF